MYKFALEPVLNHREFLEKKLQGELGILRRSLADEKRRMRAYRKAKNAFVGELKQKQSQSVTMSEISLYIGFLARLSRDIERQREKVDQVEKNLEKRLEELIDAKKKRKTLEEIKNKRLKAYNHELRRKEQNFLNEVGTTRYVRQLQQEST